MQLKKTIKRGKVAQCKHSPVLSSISVEKEMVHLIFKKRKENKRRKPVKQCQRKSTK